MISLEPDWKTIGELIVRDHPDSNWADAIRQMAQICSDARAKQKAEGKTAKERTTSERRLLGSVGVDTGRIVIGDPCYLIGDDVPLDVTENWHRDGIMRFDHGGPGAGISVATAYGDGLYPVYANLDESGSVESLTIDLK